MHSCQSAPSAFHGTHQLTCTPVVQGTEVEVIYDKKYPHLVRLDVTEEAHLRYQIYVL